MRLVPEDALLISHRLQGVLHSPEFPKKNPEKGR
jgi:hypothetical protein